MQQQHNFLCFFLLYKSTRLQYSVHRHRHLPLLAATACLSCHLLHVTVIPSRFGPGLLGLFQRPGVRTMILKGKESTHLTEDGLASY